MNQKLDFMPRVMAVLETLQTALIAIVPRTEVESRMAAVERRLQLVEQDISKVGS